MREFTGTRSRDLLLLLYHGKRKESRKQDPKTTEEINFYSGLTISRLLDSQNTVSPLLTFFGTYIFDSFCNPEKKVLEDLLQHCRLSPTEFSLGFTNCFKYDIKQLMTIYGEPLSTASNRLKAKDIATANWMLSSSPLGLSPVDDQYFKHILIETKRAAVKLTVQPAELECFLDLLTEKLPEKALLEKYGEAVLSKFIEQKLDPFASELIELKKKEFTEHLLKVEEAERAELWKLLDNNREIKIIQSAKTDEDYENIVDTINELRIQNSEKLMSIEKERRERINEIVLEIENIYRREFQ